VSQCYSVLLIYWVGQKKSWTFACIMQHSSRSASVEKCICNERTSSNMSRNFKLEHYCISRDTNRIVLPNVKQCFQAVRHLCCHFYTASPERHQSTDQQKICWIGPPFCFATATEHLFYCNVVFLFISDSVPKIFDVCKWFTTFFVDKFLQDIWNC